MTRALRDVAQFQNNLLATVRNAGEAGIPLRDALVSVTGRETPLGCDYAAADKMRKQGFLTYMKNLPRGAYTAYATNGSADKVESTLRKRARRHKAKPSTGILVTLQYGRGESVTLSYDDARNLYEQLGGLFGAD